MAKYRIVWRGSHGGELDSRTVKMKHHSDSFALADALTDMVEDQFLSPGDTITVEEVKK